MPYRYYKTLDRLNNQDKNLKIRQCRFYFDYFQLLNQSPWDWTKLGEYDYTHENIHEVRISLWEGGSVDAFRNDELVAEDIIPESMKSQFFNLDPTVQNIINLKDYFGVSDAEGDEIRIRVPTRLMQGIDHFEANVTYMMSLGHNLKTVGMNFGFGHEGTWERVYNDYGSACPDGGYTGDIIPVNYEWRGGNNIPPNPLHDGWSLCGLRAINHES